MIQWPADMHCRTASLSRSTEAQGRPGVSIPRRWATGASLLVSAAFSVPSLLPVEHVVHRGKATRRAHVAHHPVVAETDVVADEGVAGRAEICTPRAVFKPKHSWLCRPTAWAGCVCWLLLPRVEIPACTQTDQGPDSYSYKPNTQSSE